MEPYFLEEREKSHRNGNETSSFNLLDTIKRSSKPNTFQGISQQQATPHVNQGFVSFGSNFLSASASDEFSEAVAKTFLVDPRRPFFVNHQNSLDELQKNEHEIEFEKEPEREKEVGTLDRPFMITENQKGDQYGYLSTAERTFQILDAKDTGLTEAITQSPSSDGSVSTWSVTDNQERDQSLLSQSTRTRGKTDEEDNDEDDDDDDDEYEYDTDDAFSEINSQINAVEGFLDELAEVNGIHQLGGLLLNIGSSCTSYDYYDDISIDPVTGESQNVRGRSETPRTVGPPDIVSVASNVSEQISRGLHNLSLAADSILEIGTATYDSSQGANDNKNGTPENRQQSFFRSMFFSCGGGL
jgi:hypothetical protein